MSRKPRRKAKAPQKPPQTLPETRALICGPRTWPKDTIFGTPVTPSVYLPMTGNEDMVADPGWFDLFSTADTPQTESDI